MVRVAQQIWRPTALTFDDGRRVLALSGNGRGLFRVSSRGDSTWADLLPAGLSDVLVSKMHVTALDMNGDRQLFVGIGRWVIRIEMESLAWHTVSARAS
jgi:hypothetical protein